MRLSELGELGLLAELERRGLAAAIDADAAVLDGGLVVTQDALVEDVHFRLDWMSWRDLGWRAAAVNLSDLAASGAEPRRPRRLTRASPGRRASRTSSSSTRGCRDRVSTSSAATRREPSRLVPQRHGARAVRAGARPVGRNARRPARRDRPARRSRGCRVPRGCESVAPTAAAAPRGQGARRATPTRCSTSPTGSPLDAAHIAASARAAGRARARARPARRARPSSTTSRSARTTSCSPRSSDPGRLQRDRALRGGRGRRLRSTASRTSSAAGSTSA